MADNDQSEYTDEVQPDVEDEGASDREATDEAAGGTAGERGGRTRATASRKKARTTRKSGEVESTAGRGRRSPP